MRPITSLFIVRDHGTKANHFVCRTAQVEGYVFDRKKMALNIYTLECSLPCLMRLHKLTVSFENALVNSSDFRQEIAVHFTRGERKYVNNV